MGKILIVDDKESYANMLSDALQTKGYETLTELDSGKAAKVALKEGVDLVISDFVMTPLNGLELLRELKKMDETLPVILVTDKQHYPEVIREAEKEGCLDFISKAMSDSNRLVDFDDLFGKVHRALTMRELLQENKRLKTKFRLESLIGCSRIMEEVFALIQKVAPTDCTVLIQGESGTGKELVARALHELSPRRQFPMIPINCGGMPEHLLESELFGHKRGSFTNAFSDKRGLFEEAHQGTLFLDEIGTLPMSLQAKLLRTLQEKEIRRVGENTTIKVDVRIIAAANQSIAEMIKKGLFREDLYYRLSVIPLEVPPLRDRAEDIPMLVSHFLRHSHVRAIGKEMRITPDALEVLCNYQWPGNVRELQNVIERAIALSDGEQIRVQDLQQKIREPFSAASSGPSGGVMSSGLIPSLDDVVAQIEFEYCNRILKRFGGDKKKAAEALKISVPAIYRKLKPPAFAESGSDSDPQEQAG
jgi:DNA-binding NtrC family response regulator